MQRGWDCARPGGFGRAWRSEGSEPGRGSEPLSRLKAMWDNLKARPPSLAQAPARTLAVPSRAGGHPELPLPVAACQRARSKPQRPPRPICRGRNAPLSSCQKTVLQQPDPPSAAASIPRLTLKRRLAQLRVTEIRVPVPLYPQARISTRAGCPSPQCVAALAQLDVSAST
jgi:hypothetical protein